MTTAEVLEPLITKSMRVRGYTRADATARAEKWLASELGVADLSNLDVMKAWEAEAIVDRITAPPAKRQVRKMEIPQHMKQYLSAGPLGERFWRDLKAEWGEEFFNAFFGEQRTSKALLSPGQKAQRELNVQELILA